MHKLIMKRICLIVLIALPVLLSAPGCKSKIKEQKDDIYSRHLQRHVELNIISTPIPDDKSEMNLLILNDGQDMDQLRIKRITDSLYRKKLIRPLLIVGVKAGDRMKEYGVAGHPDVQGNGDKADHYADFISNELYAFCKKKTGVRKFRSVVMAGCSLGGLSAFDIAWNHADKIDKVGVFSGSFWWRDKEATDSSYNDDKNRIIITEIRSSRKKPQLQYWFYAGDKEEEGDRDKDGIIDVVDDTQDLINLLKTKQVPGAAQATFIRSATSKHDYPSWSAALPGFLVWAFGK